MDGIPPAACYPTARSRLAARLARLMPPALWLTAERAATEAISLALFALQAPRLGPEAFGLLAAAMVFAAFWEGVPGAAMTEALLSVRAIDAAHFSSITAVAGGLCLLAGAAVFAAAAPLAHVFGNAELVPVMQAMAALPLIQAFSIAPLAAAQREMRFYATATRSVLSLLASGALGFALTLAGAGVWALVAQAIAQRAIAAVILWCAVPLPFGLRFSRRHFQDVAPFIVPVALSRLVGWASGQLPRLVLGLYLGPTELGLFTLASRLNAIVHQVVIHPKSLIARVYLCRFADNPADLAPAVRRLFAQLALLTFPVCIGGAAVVPALFQAWLDPRWAGATLPSQLLLLAGLPYVTFYGCTAVLYALNLQQREVAVAAVLSAGGLAAPLIGGWFGLVPASAMVALLALAAVPLPLLVVRRHTALGLADMLLPQFPPLLAAGLMGLAVAAFGAALASAPPLLRLAVQIITGGIVYGVLLAAVLAARAVPAAEAGIPGHLLRLAARFLPAASV